jgi:hypothetical protein
MLHHFAIWQGQTHLMVLQGSKKSCMSMKVPSSATFGFPALSPLLTTGKNIVGYFWIEHVFWGHLEEHFTPEHNAK